MAKFIPFSEQCEYIKVSDVIQIETMTESLKNCLWNVIDGYIDRLILESQHDNFVKSYFQNFLKESFNKIPSGEYEQKHLLVLNYSNFNWYQVYNFIQFLYFYDTAFNFPNPPDFITNNINDVLENENSGYRLIDGKIVPITDEGEITEIQEAIDENSDSGVAEHLKTALKHLSDKTSKDYRNSVKESISGVEAYVRAITEKNELGPALKELQNKKIIIPEVLKQGFEKIYGWTCGSDGIRHAIMDGANPVDMAEAKFMLVACSAFINYLKMKQN